MSDERKQINDFTAGEITDNSDALLFQTSGGATKKILWSKLIERIINNHIANGQNITLQRSGNVLTISASGAGQTYTEGAGISLANDAISVKLGQNLSINPETGNIDATGGGTAATVDVGTTTTGAAGTNASVTNSGTTSNAVFNFTIPRGADGNDGVTPHIDSTSKHWYIGNTDTGIVAEGEDGTNGTNGVTPHIDPTSKHWYIGETDTNIVAEGENGAAGADGASISASASAISGGHRVTISSTDAQVSDVTFDVMDGTEIIQTSSDDRTVTLTVVGWTGASVPYTQTVTVSGMTSSIVPIIAPSYSDTVATALEQQAEWSKITKAVSGTDTVTFKCYEDKPTVELTAIIKVV